MSISARVSDGLIDVLAEHMGAKHPELLPTARWVIGTVRKQLGHCVNAIAQENRLDAGRAREAWLMRHDGRTYQEIANKFRISVTRARKVVLQADMHMASALANYTDRSSSPAAEGIWHTFTTEGRTSYVAPIRTTEWMHHKQACPKSREALLHLLSAAKTLEHSARQHA